MSEKTNELYILTQKAQKMEMINEEIALGIYLEIFEKYTPKISKTYESAIRLLEKRHRLTEALTICNQAIELINADEVSGIVDRFEATKTRLVRKLSEEGILPEDTEKKKYKFKIRHLVFLIISILLIIAILRFATPYDELDVNLEGKDSLDGGPAGFGTDTDPDKDSPEIVYPVTETMIGIATDEIMKNIDVERATIIPQGDTLGVAIIVKPGTSEERSKELGTLYIKALAGTAAATYEDLRSPSDTTLGGLYEHYVLVISVGTGSKEEDFTAKGSTTKGAKSIYWRKLD